jgi:phage terminase small subunit
MASKNQYGLNVAQEAYAQARARGETQLDSYRTAYPKSAGAREDTLRPRASNLEKLPLVSARIASLQAAARERGVVAIDDVTREIASIAFSDMAKLVDTNGVVRKLHEMDPATRAAIASIKHKFGGVIEIKFWDKNAALDKLAKILGMYALDNKQKADPLAALLGELSGRIVEPVSGD